MNQPDYIFVPSKATRSRMVNWRQLDRLQSRDALQAAIFVVVAALALKGLVLLGLSFQLLMPLGEVAAAILGFAQVCLYMIVALGLAIGVSALIGFTSMAVWRSVVALRHRLAA